MLTILILCIAKSQATSRRDASFKHFSDYLADQRDRISYQVKANNESLIQFENEQRANRIQTLTLLSEDIEKLSSNNTKLWTKRIRIEQECHELLALSPLSRAGHLYDELDGFSIQIAANNARICEIRSLQLNQIGDDLTHPQEQLTQNNAELLVKKKKIEHALGELMAVSERESPDFRCLVALCRGLKNKRLPSGIVRPIVMEAKERMYQKHVQFIIDWGFASGYGYLDDYPIRSLKNIVFPGNTLIINLMNHPIESYENTHFRNLRTETLTYNEMDLSSTTMDTPKLKQIKFPLNLQSLDLSSNPNITSFENVSFPPNLFRCSVSGCALDAHKIKSLKLPRGLEKMEMAENALHGEMDAVCELIGSFPRLDWLDLSYNNLTASDYKQLSVVISAHPTLQILYLSGNSNDNISALQLPKDLYSLDWRGVSWNHQQLEELNEILPDNLQCLGIEDFNESDPIIEHMKFKRHFDIT